REGQMEKGRESFVAFPLRQRDVVGDIESPATKSLHPAGEEMLDRGDRVVTVDLIEKTTHPALFNRRAPFEHFFEMDGSPGTVDARESQDDAAGVAGDGLRLAEEMARLAIRPGFGFLGDDRAVDLAVDAAAAGKEDRHAGEDFVEIPQSLHKNRTIGLRAAAAGTGAMDDDIRFSRGQGGGDHPERVPRRDIAGEHRIRGAGFGEAAHRRDRESRLIESSGEGGTEVAVADEKRTWSSHHLRRYV